MLEPLEVDPPYAADLTSPTDSGALLPLKAMQNTLPPEMSPILFPDSNWTETDIKVEDEFKKVIDLVLYVFKSLGFEDFSAQVSLRDPTKAEKYFGTDEAWDIAENGYKFIREMSLKHNL